MTMTVKLDPLLEQRLRLRSAALGRPASELLREALVRYLDATPESAPSAFSLGRDLFGRHHGPTDLAERRKEDAAAAWMQRHAARR